MSLAKLSAAVSSTHSLPVLSSNVVLNEAQIKEDDHDHDHIEDFVVKGFTSNVITNSKGMIYTHFNLKEAPTSTELTNKGNFSITLPTPLVGKWSSPVCFLVEKQGDATNNRSVGTMVSIKVTKDVHSISGTFDTQTALALGNVGLACQVTAPESIVASENSNAEASLHFSNHVSSVPEVDAVYRIELHAHPKLAKSMSVSASGVRDTYGKGLIFEFKEVSSDATSLVIGDEHSTIRFFGEEADDDHDHDHDHVHAAAARNTGLRHEVRNICEFTTGGQTSTVEALIASDHGSVSFGTGLVIPKGNDATIVCSKFTAVRSIDRLPSVLIATANAETTPISSTSTVSLENSAVMASIAATSVVVATLLAYVF